MIRGKKIMKCILSLMLSMVMTAAVLPVCVKAEETIEVNKTNFPDYRFRTYIKENITGHSDVLTQEEIDQTTSIYVEECYDLKGISYFTALEELKVLGRPLNMDFSKNPKLKTFTLIDDDWHDDENEKLELNLLSNTELESLDIENESLASLDLSGNTALKTLKCSETSLQTLDLSGHAQLESAECTNCDLETLNLSGDTALKTLDCSDNKLKTLDLSENVNLADVDCSYNQLLTLDLSHSPNAALKNAGETTQEIAAAAEKNENGQYILEMDQLNGIPLDYERGEIKDRAGGTWDEKKHVMTFEKVPEDPIIYSYSIGAGDQKLYAAVYPVMDVQVFDKATENHDGTYTPVYWNPDESIDVKMDGSITCFGVDVLTPRDYLYKSEISCSIRDTDIASVESWPYIYGHEAFRIAGKNPGETEMVVKEEETGIQRTYKVKVEEEQTDEPDTPEERHVTSINVHGAGVKKLNVNETFKIVYYVWPSDAENRDVTWTSDDPSVATVSSDGAVKGISQGVACITGTSVDNPEAADEIVIIVKGSGSSGSTGGGSSGSASGKTPAQEEKKETVILYRLYNPNSGEHFYTHQIDEKKKLVALGWKDEGIAWISPAVSDIPVIRLYNENGGEHHYTSNQEEVSALVEAGWKYEGIAWYSDPDQTVPIYRQYNPNAASNNHNYTGSTEEKDHLIEAGWSDEKIGWYALSLTE